VRVSTFKDITANGDVYGNRHYLWDTLSNNKNNVVCLLKARIMKPAETAIARKRLCRHFRCWAVATTHMHATIKELLEAVFSVRFVPRLYNKRELPLQKSIETALSRVGGGC
jgi:hypothetical protein